MARVVRNVGTLKRAVSKDGSEVLRQEHIYLSSHQQWYACLNTDNHFIYKSRTVGVTTLCTCGSPAVCVGYGQYRKYSSYLGNEVLACQSLIQHNQHADGST